MLPEEVVFGGAVNADDALADALRSSLGKGNGNGTGEMLARILIHEYANEEHRFTEILPG
jgi:hypothetical protein